MSTCCLEMAQQHALVNDGQMSLTLFLVSYLPKVRATKRCHYLLNIGDMAMATQRDFLKSSLLKTSEYTVLIRVLVFLMTWDCLSRKALLSVAGESWFSSVLAQALACKQSLLALLSDTHCCLLSCCNTFRRFEIDCGIIYRKWNVFYLVYISILLWIPPKIVSYKIIN